MASFSDRMKEQRQRAGMTQEALGQVIGTGPDSICVYEKGRNYPEVRKLIILAEFFNVSVDYLLGRTDDPEVHQLEPR